MAYDSISISLSTFKQVERWFWTLIIGVYTRDWSVLAGKNLLQLGQLMLAPIYASL
jgi:hypothetical protein